MGESCKMERLDSEQGMPKVPTRLRILLADDHRDLLEEMCQLLTPEFAVVRSVTEGLALVEAAREVRPDVVVTDMNMPGLNGIDAGRQILQGGMCDAVVILTVYNEPQMVRSALEAGIRGYILKVDAGEELTAAIQRVVTGHTYLSRGVSGT
jgi:DNA-binding NarL/FixJ family response regulator